MYKTKRRSEGSIVIQALNVDKDERSQSAAVAPTYNDKADSEEDDDDDESIPRARGGTALRPRPGHFLVLRPMLGEVKIFDGTTLKDLIGNVGEDNGQPSFVFKILNVLAWFWSIPVMLLMTPLLPFYGPFAMLSLTGASRPLFDENYALTRTFNVSGNNTTGTHTLDIAASVWEPPWGAALDSTCIVLLVILCAGIIYGIMYASMEIHPAVWRLTMEESKIQVGVALGLSVVYAASAGSLLPNALHVLWLVLRCLLVWFMVVLDSISVAKKLRQSAKAHAKQIGTEGKKGYFSILLCLLCVSFFTVDVFRHWLVLFVSDRVEMIQFGLQNPITGNNFAFSNHQLADACFFTNMIMSASVSLKVAKAHVGAGTVLLRTRFAIARA